MYINRCCNIWVFTLHVLQGAFVVFAYETSSPRRSHIQSREITWKPEHDGKIYQYITSIVFESPHLHLAFINWIQTFIYKNGLYPQ